MGIQGLESFLLHKHRPACPTISIPETAAKYRSETGRVPVALVDGSALPYYVSGSLNQRSGGQFKELKEKVVAFAERLRSTGVSPVFFFKGAPNVGQLAVWEQRRRQHLDRVAKEFESLETNANRKHKTTKQPMEPAHAEAGVSQAASDIQGSHNAPAVDAELAAADGDVTNSQETAAEQALYAPIKDDAELALSATTVDTGTRLILDGVQEQAIVVQDDVKESPVIVEPFVAAPHEGVHKMALEGSAMTTVATSTVTEDRVVVDTSTCRNEDKTEQEDIILATSTIPEQEDIILATSTIPEQEDIILATSAITELEDTEETDIILSTPTITEEIDIILGTPTITEETDIIPATPKVREELFFGMLREESEIYLATPRLRDDTVIPATPRLRDDTVIPATPSLTAGEKADLESPLLNQHDVLDVERTRSSNAEGVATEPVLAANDRVDVPLIVIEDDVVERMTEAVDSVLVGESSLDVEVLNGEIAVEPACAAHHENDLKKTQKCVDRKVNTPVHPAQEKIVEPLIVTIDDDVEPSVAAQGYVGAGRVSLSCDSATVASPALADDPPIVNQPALSHQFKSVVLDPTRPVWRPFPRLNTEMDSAVSPLPGEGDVVSSHPDMTREPSPAVQPYFDDNSYIVESFHGYNRPKSWSNGSNVSEHGSGDSGGRGKGRRGGRVERDYRGRDDDHQGRDGGRRGRDGGHRGRDGGRRGRDGSRQDRDGSRQDRDGSHQGRDGSHQGRDGSHQGRDGSRRGRGGVHRSDDGNIIGAFDGGRGVGRHGGFGGGYEGGFDGGPGVAFYGGFPSALPGVLPGALPGALPGGFEGFGQGFFTGVNGSHLGLGSLVGSSGDYHCGGVDGERHRSLDRRQQHNSTAPTGMAGSTGVTGQWGARKHRSKQPRRLQPTVLPEGAYECAKLALQEAGFQVIVSEEEADLEMARYARENDCFCILTTDSDFVAMDGARYLLSLSHLEEESMTTVSFNRRALARRLEIPCHQLPMLFSLFPNNCVPSSYLHPLHHRLTGGAYDKLNIEHSFHFEEVFPKLLNLVRNELNRKSAQDAVAAIIIKALASYPAERLNRYAQQLNFRDRWGLREALTQQLEASLRSHDYTPPRPFSPLPPAPDAPARALDSRVLAVARARHTSLAFLTPSVLTVLDKGIMEQALGLEDPRVPLGSESALRPFRRRLYGLLLGKDGPAVVREFILPNRVPDDAKLQPVDAQVVVPDPELLPARGLLALWGIPDVDDESSTEKRDAGVDSAVGTQEATDAVCDIKCSEGTSGDAVQEAEVTLGVENPEVVEEMKSTHDEDVEILEEAAVVTSIAARVSVEDPAALNEARWRLLAWCLCPAMSSGIVEGEGLANRLRAIPLGLVLPTAALFLVHHSGALGAALGAAKEAARLAAQAAADVEDAAAASSSASVCSSESPAPSTPTADDAAPQLTYEAAGAAAAAAAGAPTVVEAATSRGSRGRREVPLPETSEELVRLVARACIITGKLSAAKICKLTYQGPHRLAVHVAAIFMKAWHNLAVLNDALGALIPLQLMNPADVFDGKVFQRTFSRMGLPADCDEPLLEAMVGAACLGGDEACALCCADRTGASNEAAVE